MNDRAAGFITEPIVQTDGAVDFDCGKAELNSFFARHAYSNDERGIGKTFVLRRKEEEEGLPLVIGFYTLSMGDIDASVLPRKLRGNLPKYPLPVALIGRFAVDERAQGRGFGDALMSDALERVLMAAESVGCFGIAVDAKDEKAVAYYRRIGFVVLDSDAFPRRMLLLMATLRASLRPEKEGD